MARRIVDTTWVNKVPARRYPRGPYEDYGWEAHQSVLLPFRDPSVHLMPYELEHEPMPRPGAGSTEYERSDLGYAYGQGYMEGGLYDTWHPRTGRSYTGLGPRGYQRPDARILEDVGDLMTRHAYLDASDIEVRVENAEVTLTGTVDSRWAKRVAEDIADEVRGVRDVHNQLKIRREQPREKPAQRGAEPH